MVPGQPYYIVGYHFLNNNRENKCSALHYIGKGKSRAKYRIYYKTKT